MFPRRGEHRSSAGTYPKNANADANSDPFGPFGFASACSFRACLPRTTDGRPYWGVKPRVRICIGVLFCWPLPRTTDGRPYWGVKPRVWICFGGLFSFASAAGERWSPLLGCETAGVDLLRRVVFVCLCCGRAMLAPTRSCDSGARCDGAKLFFIFFEKGLDKVVLLCYCIITLIQ